VLDSESSQRNGFTKADVATFELLATLVAPRIASALAERDLSVAIDDLARAESSHRDRVASMQRQRLESLGQLAGGIAHDFNNLLTAILGNVTLAKDLVPPGVAVGLLAEAQESCGKARELSRQLVAFSAGGAPMLQPGDPFELLRELVDRQFGDGRVALRWLLPDQLPVVAFDRGQLRDALRHLLRNAAEAMPGGGALEISARVLVGKDRVVEIAITDSGAGVPSPLRSTIFDPYFTTKEGASGLGLSTAFWILRRHGGSLELDPAPTAGARFVVTLPVMAEVRRSGDGERGHRLRVLVLDDDIAVRRVLVRMLESLGHRVASAGDGEGCVREFAAGMAQGGFDVVMLDLTLRHGIGWDETFAGLRQLDPSCVVMAMSGYHDSPVMANCRQHGFSGALSKPFSGQELDRALAEAVAAGPVAAPR
jgi:signal transduction histidine kinase/ActR/RegA family two-component response regulator